MYLNYLMMFMLSKFIFFNYNKYILLNLISLEFMMITICNFMFFTFTMLNQCNYLMYFLIFFISEGIMGLTLLIQLIRYHGNDNLTFLNMMYKNYEKINF